LESTNNWVLLI
jgi:hypothetical protein